MIEHVRRFSLEEWRLLPLDTRQRWWLETDYGAHPEKASLELLKMIKEALEADDDD